jgi:predicted DNA-binding transcriptional regulator YafY
MIETIFIFERLDYLISTNNTGTRKKLAEKFNVSERTISRWIEIMKSYGAEIEFNRAKRSFIYSKAGRFEISMKFKLK